VGAGRRARSSFHGAASVAAVTATYGYSPLSPKTCASGGSRAAAEPASCSPQAPVPGKSTTGTTGATGSFDRPASEGDGWHAASQARRDGQGVECHLSCRCSGGVGPRHAQIRDQCGVVGLNAVDGLARARTEVDDGLPVRERYDSPLRAKERPALQLANQVLPPSGHGSDRISTRGHPSAQARSSTATSGTGPAGAIRRAHSVLPALRGSSGLLSR